jgi:hypothetical protein
MRMSRRRMKMRRKRKGGAAGEEGAGGWAGGPAGGGSVDKRAGGGAHGMFFFLDDCTSYVCHTLYLWCVQACIIKPNTLHKHNQITVNIQRIWNQSHYINNICTPLCNTSIYRKEVVDMGMSQGFSQQLINAFSIVSLLGVHGSMAGI